MRIDWQLARDVLVLLVIGALLWWASAAFVTWEGWTR